MEGSVLKAFAILIGIVAGLGLLLYLVKKFGQKYRDPENQIDLKVMARVPLQSKSNLYVVRVSGRTLLIGSSDSSINTLADLTEDFQNSSKKSPQRKLPQKEMEKMYSQYRKQNPEGDSLSFSNFIKSSFKRG